MARISAHVDDPTPTVTHSSPGTEWSAHAEIATLEGERSVYVYYYYYYY